MNLGKKRKVGKNVDKSSKDTIEFKYSLGIKVRDRVTLAEGIIDMRAEFLNGCIRYSVQPQTDKPNADKRPESYWIDEAQLEYVDEGINEEKPVEKSKTGGPVESSSNARA